MLLNQKNNIGKTTYIYTFTAQGKYSKGPLPEKLEIARDL